MKTKKMLLLIAIGMFNLNAILIGIVIWVPPIVTSGEWIDPAQSRSLMGLSCTKFLIVASIITMFYKGFHNDEDPVATTD